MRMKKSRVQQYYLKKRTVKKDNEGSTYEEYGAALPFLGEVWPASGKVQAEMYGQRLPYICNCKMAGAYTVCTEKNGCAVYDFGDYTVSELDGICVNASTEEPPDYKIISIKPYRPLYMELEKR